MKVGYVVLYVKDINSCLDFWTKQIGLKIKETNNVGQFLITRIGFENQDFSLELVPLEMMKDNPDGLDLASPSMCFYVEDIDENHKKLKNSQVQVTDISIHFGKKNFAFSDNEGRWFAVLEG